MPTCAALSGIIELSEFGGDFTRYEDHLYNNVFKQQLYNNKLYYKGKVVSLKKNPIFQNREDSFFHLTSKNYTGECDDRWPDFRRCERLHWIKPAIEYNHVDLCHVDCFCEYKKMAYGKSRTVLLNVEQQYNVILEERKDYYLLITAYFIEHPSRLQKEIKALETYRKQQETP